MTEHTEVVVYSQPNCGPCREVERYLEEQGVPFLTRDVTSDPGALNDLVERGFMATPVTQIGARWVAGFSRDKLKHAIVDFQGEPTYE